MGLLIRAVEYIHSPILEIETTGGVRFTIEELNGGLVIKGQNEMFAEWGKPGEVVIRQVKEEVENWPELRVIHGC